jgi:hypothetical protein
LSKDLLLRKTSFDIEKSKSPEIFTLDWQITAWLDSTKFDGADTSWDVQVLFGASHG